MLEIIEELNKSKQSKAILKAFKNQLEENNETDPAIIAKMREAAIMLAIEQNEKARKLFLDKVRQGA